MRNRSTATAIVVALLGGLFAWFMGDALFGDGMFAFRDAAHYYYPLFQFIGDEWAAGRVPLWNPYENLGQPLAADPTASVFYPGKLIFALPLSFAWAYKTYIMAHLLLAAGAAYWLARRFGGSVAAGGVCAISYAFSGNVLMLHCNVVFFVGAAWLPLAVLAADRMLVQRSPRQAVVFGMILALIVLGGDPQTAYHAGLLAVLYALWLWWLTSPLSLWERVATSGPLSLWERVRVRAARRQTPNPTRPHPGPLPKGEGAMRRRFPRTRPVLLVLAAATGLALSAVQVLPSLEYAAQSGRTAGNFADRLFCRLDPGTHAEEAYHFSVGPWRLAEYVWPNFSGRQFPIHRRWLDVLPAEGRIWTPTFYMGLLPLLLALSALRLRPGSRCRAGVSPAPNSTARLSCDCWLSWSVVLAVVASFGWYGLGWLIQEVRVAAGGDPAAAPLIAQPFGGLYWLMTVVLPGYASFRYPAKLLVVTALGLSVLAARGWDQTFAGQSPRLRRLLVWIGGLSTCGAVGLVAVGSLWCDWLAAAEPNVLFGPLDMKGAFRDLLGGFFQTAVLCGLYLCLLRGRWGHRRATRAAGSMTKQGTVPFAAGIALISVAVDIAIANGWLVACAPASLWAEPSKAAEVLQQETQERGQSPFSSQTGGEETSNELPINGTVPRVSQPYRVFRHPIWMRPVWQASGAPTRLAEAVHWEVDSLWPKYNLPHRIALAEVPGAMSVHDYEVFLSCLHQAYLLLAEYAVWPGAEGGLEGIVVPGAEDFALGHNPDHLPRAWIVHDLCWLPELDSTDLADVQQRTKDVLFPTPWLSDLRTSAFVECGSVAGIGGGPPPFPFDRKGTLPWRSGDAVGESCEVAHYSPLRVEIEAVLLRPGLVVLCDQFYPGWRLEVEKIEQAGQAKKAAVPVLRTNRVMRGAWLPAGQYRLVYQYRPTSFLCGAGISAVAWVALFVVAVVVVKQGLRRKPSEKG